jgi:hypothetical protein
MAALADGKIIPTIAFPAKVTIPDQRALICYTNGMERLVIETRFTGAGTNFAWVVPLPSQPVIEEATTGLFPTLGYLFRPEIVHEVPPYYLGILLALGILYLLRLAAKSVWNAFVIAVIFLPIAVLLLSALAAGKRKSASMGSESVPSGQNVSILDRKLVGIFETTTITSHDTKALQTWLTENEFALPTNSEPVIASYVKDGWVFVVAKVRRDKPESETSTPHPLSFTFKTDKPVYPIRLTGLDNGPLSVELYVFGPVRAEAPHFKVESCTRPHFAHPLLHKWVGDSTAVTKLTAALSTANMRKDIWLNWTAFSKKESLLFSWQGALTTALNWGAGLFAAGLLVVCLLAFASEKYKIIMPRLVGIAAIASVAVVGLSYLCLPKIEVKLVKGYPYSSWKYEQIALRIAWGDANWQTLAQARAGFQELISNPTNAAVYDLKNWDNYFVGGQLREEDSPGNYLLRETNSQLQLIFFNTDGGEMIVDTSDLRIQH